MKPNKIVLTDQGIGCIEAPEKPEPSYSHIASSLYINTQWYKETGGYKHPMDWYNEKLEAAIKQAVLFKDQSHIKRLLSFNGISSLSDNELIPIPDGYEIELETKDLCDYEGEELWEITPHLVKYAILVPKQVDIDPDVKDALNKGGYWDLIDDDKPKQEPVKGAGDDYPVIDLKHENLMSNLRDSMDQLCGIPKQESKCKEYCNCAREAMQEGANRDWVDGIQDKCPLIPKQEPVKEKFEEQVPLIGAVVEIKQPTSIEEAADAYMDSKYPKTYHRGDEWKGFIAGAKSDAAKEYWYQQFKEQLLDSLLNH